MSNDRTMFAKAFIEAALWADTPEDATATTLHIDSLAGMENFAGAFYDCNRQHIEAYPGGLVQAGHDLWFTTNGHGVGYWENSDEASQALDEACKAFGHRYSDGLEQGDDGFLHWCNL